MRAIHAMHTTPTGAMEQPTAAPACRPTHRRQAGRPRGSRRTLPSVLLRSLAEANAAGVCEVASDALERVWYSGFCAGAASVAPDRVRRCANCDESFVAGHRREIYCGARCRNAAVKRRYRARLRARARQGGG